MTDLVVQITLTMDVARAQQLWTTGAKCFLAEQLDRFESITGLGVYPTQEDAERFAGGTMHWCRGGADALLFEAYERAHGYDTLILWDLVSAENDLEDNRPYEATVVVSTRDWEQEMADLVARNAARRAHNNL